LLDKPAIEFNFCFAQGDYKSALGKLWALAEEGVQEGNRNMRFWGMASDMVAAGFDPEVVHGLLSFINHKQVSPLPDEEMRAIVLSAGRR
jgi:hypothetical protein